MFCGLHDTYTPGCSLCVKKERITSAFGLALDGVAEANAILAKGHEHAARQRGKLARAVQSLDAYLAELER